MCLSMSFLLSEQHAALFKFNKVCFISYLRTESESQIIFLIRKYKDLRRENKTVD